MNTPAWPELDFNKWKDTLATLHLFTQIVGKIRLRSMPWLNHSWHVTLYVTPQGLSTGSMPYTAGIFEITFDFHRHILVIITSTGIRQEVKLYPRTVADFYAELFDKLKQAGIEVSIYPVPNELEHVIPFQEDEVHKSYNAVQVENFWQALIHVHKVFTKFRADFRGKASPVHFFWGAFDLAVTRFSGRPAPLHPGGAPNMPVNVMQEAYSHEVSSCGFWPGSEAFPHAAFYAYCYPTPPAYAMQQVEPAEAFYSKEMGEFFVLYDLIRRAADPETMLMQFITSTYKAAAETCNWNRATLECDFSAFNQ
jgi:hypothetical protein